MSKLLSLVGVAFLSMSAMAVELPTLPIEKMQAQLNRTVSIVFNDESETLYGDLLANKLHLNKVCAAIEQMTVNKPLAIFIDMDVLSDLDGALCIVQAAKKNDIKITIDFDPNELSVATRDEIRTVSVGYALVATKVIDGFEFPAPDKMNGAVHWLNPLTRVSLAKPAIRPIVQPAYFISMINGLDDASFRRLNFSWVRAVTLAEFSERLTPKIAIQDVIAGKTEALAGKFAFIGVDQDKYDSMSNRDGEIVNGVFLHQQFTAAYLALIAEDLKPVKGEMIIFGKYNGD